MSKVLYSVQKLHKFMKLVIFHLFLASSCVRGGLDWILGKISLLKEWSGIRTGCPGKWWSHYP